ncbi:MAG: hypothetical protein AXA67_05865 [Methylothermaceae bacteria B42]|nr:MAG: hypothetical protein AXA67_05865 [Methylothermaceae bacteria B42]
MNIYPLPKKMTHEQINLLLPWYANGTLKESEKRQVKVHLRQCARCRKALEQLNHLSQAIEETPDLAVSPKMAMDRFWRQVAAEENPPAQSTGKPRQPQWMDSFFGSPAAAALAFSMILMPLILLIMAQLQSRKMEDTPFRTLSSSSPFHYQANDIRLIFSTEIDRSRLKYLLQPLATDFQIIEGGAMAGHSAFVVRFKNPGNSAELRDRLRNLPQVIFAEPATPTIQRSASPGGST